MTLISLPIFSHFPFPLSFLSLPRPLRLRLRRRTPTPILSSAAHDRHKILLIMGATGSGKSSLSLDLASRFPCSEIINSDKMQLYSALDITTNKIPLPHRRAVPHHLLGDFDPFSGELSAADFRSLASRAVSGVVSRGNLPLVVGGSNSYIHALVAAHFDPDVDVFAGAGRVSAEFRYQCCFLWVDVSLPVLKRYLWKRVDDMIDSGMVSELAEFYDPEVAESPARIGVRKAIGVPEFEEYFRRHHPKGREYRGGADPVRAGAYEDAVRKIKENTWRLTKRQLGKIGRLRGAGWDLKRVDATAAVAAVMSSEAAEKRSEIWERQVVEPSIKIVKRFMEE